MKKTKNNKIWILGIVIIIASILSPFILLPLGIDVSGLYTGIGIMIGAGLMINSGK